MGPFQKLDTTLEDEIQKLEVGGKVPRLEDILQTSDEEVLKYSSYAINILALLLPVMLVFGVYLYSSSIKEEIQVRRDIIKGIQDYGRYKTRLTQLESKVVSTRPVKDKKSISGNLNTILSRGTKTTGTVKVGEFDQFEKGESILVSEGTIEFTKFSQTELTNLIRKMASSLKMKIIEAEIFKDEKTKFLKGMFRFTHYGKK